MHQLEVVADAVERFRVAQKEIAVGQKIVIEVLNHTPFGNQIKIDQHVAAKDQVETFHEGHATVVGKIQTAEGDTVANLRLDLKKLARRSKKFVAMFCSQVAGAIGAVDRLLRVGQRPLIQVGGKDLNGPVF